MSGQEIEDRNFNSFKEEIVTNSKGVVIVNFWATWCKPCVQELPVFERINSELKAENAKVYLINLDFNSKYKTSVAEFLDKRELRSKVIHLNDTDPNNWINKIDSSWSGAIPATVIYNDGKKIFFKEGEITYEEIISKINKFIKKQY